MDLITRTEAGDIVATKEAIETIRDFEIKIKELKEKEDELKKRLIAEMEANKVLSLKSDLLSITYVAPTTRESLDSKTLKEELPDIYDAYCKISPVKASVRIKVER